MNSKRRLRLRLFPACLLAALSLAASAAFAECRDSTSGIVTRTPAANQAITCDTSLPNPVTTSVQAATPSSQVSITIEAGATISLSLAAVRVDNLSAITNYGSVSTVGGNNAHGIYTDAASPTVGYGNTLTNHGSVTTVGTGSIGLFARTRHATEGNKIVNTGTIATSGASNSPNNASGIRAESLASTTIENSGTITAGNTLAGRIGNGIEMAGPGTIANTGTVTSAQGCGILGSDLVYSGNTYSGVTLNNTGTISGTSAAGCAIRLGNGADTVVLGAGSVLTGSIDGGGVSAPFTGADRLIFDGLANNNFNNTVTRFNLLQATGGANVALTSATSYPFDSVQIDTGSTLAFNGSQTIASFTNSGTLDLSYPGTAGTHLTVGDYTGGGTIAMNTHLEPAQPTDQLIITGTVAGSTALHITSLGGTGVPAGSDGILIVDASSATLAPGAAFTLAAPPPTAGGKTYALYQGNLAGGNPQNWYLRPAALPPAPAAPVPTLNPAALALLALMLGWLAAARRKRNPGTR